MQQVCLKRRNIIPEDSKQTSRSQVWESDIVVNVNVNVKIVIMQLVE